TTAIAAGGRPEERAKMVSRSVVILRIRLVRRLRARARQTRLHGAAADHPPMIVGVPALNQPRCPALSSNVDRYRRSILRKPSRPRDQSLFAAAQAQPRRLVAMG